MILIIKILFNCFYYILLIRVLLSWFSYSSTNNFTNFIFNMTEPLSCHNKIFNSHKSHRNRFLSTNIINNINFFKNTAITNRIEYE